MNEEFSVSNGLVLRDLRSLLRQSFGNDVEVVNCETELLLPKGENYSSTMVKVDARIKRTPNSPEELLGLVAKMIVKSEFMTGNIDMTLSFKREIYAFDKVISKFQKLQREAGLKEHEIINITPKVYGLRFSLDPSKMEVDDDVVLLMENLRLLGFQLMDRKTGVDLAHASLAVKELAKFHALGIICKYRDPEFFQTTNSFTKEKTFKDMEELKFVNGLAEQDLLSDPRLEPYYAKIKSAFSRGWEEMFERSPESIWTTITHGDFWLNNMMFAHDFKNQPTKIKFLDFQLLNCNCGLRDLLYFIGNSCDANVVENYLDEILNDYYESFIAMLEKMNFSTKDFSRKNFYEQIDMEGPKFFTPTAMGLKFVTSEVEREFDLNDPIRGIMTKKVNDRYRQRILVIVKKFAEKGWI